MQDHFICKNLRVCFVLDDREYFVHIFIHHAIVMTKFCKQDIQIPIVLLTCRCKNYFQFYSIKIKIDFLSKIFTR